MTDVRIPDANRIGAVGEGWRVALTTLMNERIGDRRRRRRRQATARRSGQRRRRGLERSLDESARTGARKDELMQLWVRGEVGRLTNMRAAAGGQGRQPRARRCRSPSSRTAELNKRLYDFCIDLMGADGQVGYDYTFRRPDRARRHGRRQGLAATRSCGCGPTRSRAAPARSCATSSASRCSACPANRGSTRTRPGRRCPAAEGRCSARPVRPSAARIVRVPIRGPAERGWCRIAQARTRSSGCDP